MLNKNEKILLAGIAFNQTVWICSSLIHLGVIKRQARVINLQEQAISIILKHVPEHDLPALQEDLEEFEVFLGLMGVIDPEETK